MTRKNKLCELIIDENSGPMMGRSITYVYRNVTQLAKDTWTDVVSAYQFICPIFYNDNKSRVVNKELNRIDNSYLDVKENPVVVKFKNNKIAIYDEYMDMPRNIITTNVYENILYKLFG